MINDPKDAVVDLKRLTKWNKDGVLGKYTGTPIIKVYQTLTEFDFDVKRKLEPQDLEEFKDCTFVPLKMYIDESDMSINALIVPVKNKG